MRMLGGLPGYSSLISGATSSGGSSASAPGVAARASSAAAKRQPVLSRIAVRELQHEGGAGRLVGRELEVAALDSHQLARDGEAEAGAARTGRAFEGNEQALQRLGREAGPVIRHLDLHLA